MHQILRSVWNFENWPNNILSADSILESRRIDLSVRYMVDFTFILKVLLQRWKLIKKINSMSIHVQNNLYVTQLTNVSKFSWIYYVHYTELLEILLALQWDTTIVIIIENLKLHFYWYLTFHKRFQLSNWEANKWYGPTWSIYVNKHSKDKNLFIRQAV